MANDAWTQQALAQDASFRLRVRNALASIAWTVLGEPTSPTHATRAAYARAVLGDLDGYAASIARSLVTRPSLMSAITYPLVDANWRTGATTPTASICTEATDVVLVAQLTTDWDALAGVG